MSAHPSSPMMDDSHELFRCITNIFLMTPQAQLAHLTSFSLFVAHSIELLLFTEQITYLQTFLVFFVRYNLFYSRQLTSVRTAHVHYLCY